MPQDDSPTDVTIALTAAGVTVLIDASGGRLPSVLHWGHEIPGIDGPTAAALVAASPAVVGSNNINPVPRLAVLPEHHLGWTGRPGLSGSRAGAAWAPAFRARAVTLDGAPVTGFRSAGAGVIEVLATDDEAALELRLILDLRPSGLLRARAAVRNLGADTYQVDDLVLAFPVPAEAAELLDFTGRHNLERVPQRQPFRMGIHLRENRKGRTGADSAYVLHAGTPGFGFATGEVWGVHTAWSGNHTHYAERVFTGEGVLGGGELLLPGENRLGTGETYESPWLYGAYGT